MANPYQQFFKQPEMSEEDRIRALIDGMRHKELENRDGTIKKMPYLNPMSPIDEGPDYHAGPYRPKKIAPGKGRDYENAPYFPKKDPLVLEEAPYNAYEPPVPGMRQPYNEPLPAPPSMRHNFREPTPGGAQNLYLRKMPPKSYGID